MVREFEANLRVGDEVETVDVRDLEDQIRRGQRERVARLRYAPWTGEDWLPIGALPALAEAWEAPGARLVTNIRAFRFPVAALSLCLLVIVAGLIELLAFEGIQSDPALADLYDGLLGQMMVGAAPLFLDGRWWTPWTASLLHADALHLIGNLTLLAYCGYRVERALGAGALWMVAATAVGSSTLFITLGSELPVIGSSMIAYGLWGAQIAAGFRFGDELPPGYRRYYGWGNLFIFIPLYINGLSNPASSHLGHLGGLLGGGLCAFLLRAETQSPAAAEGARTRKNLVLAALIALLPAGLAPLGALAPTLVLGGMERQSLPELGMSLDLPGRMAGEPLRYLGMRAWVLDPNDQEPVFAGLWFANEAGADLEAASRKRWQERLGGEPLPTEAPTPIGPGWSAAAYTLQAASGQPWRIVEHSLRQGRYIWRVGYTLRADRWGPGRERLYDDIVRTVIPGDPPALVEARDKLALLPGSDKLKVAYAEKLGLAGRIAEAEAQLDAVTDPDWAWTVADDRLWLAVEFPGESSRDAGDYAAEMLRTAPTGYATVLVRALQHLSGAGDCAPVEAFARDRMPEARAYFTASPGVLGQLEAATVCPAPPPQGP